MGQLASHHSHSIMNKFKGLLFLSVFVCFSHSQLKFGGSSSGSSSGSGSGSSNTQNKQSSGDTDQRIISTGNQFVDGGILGLGAGLVGSAVLGGALNGGGSNPCGRRRRRQADDGKTDTRFFGLENLLGGGNNCGCNCGGYYPQNNYPQNNYPQNNYPQNNYPSSSGFTQQRCQCNYNLTFRDRYGNIHGACRRADNTGRTWCYTNGGCADGQPSSRFPNNPWSYQACNNYGK